MFKVCEVNYEDRTGNLKSEASGVVSSTKFFPTYGNLIYKPLSKTKPLSTPLFSYAEVYWSYLINKYIDRETPRYSLARCYNIDEYQPKYYDKGTLVPNILGDGEYLVNILELFRMMPDKKVDIETYINYCEMIYDFETILDSDFFLVHEDLAEKLAEQVLTSILRRDDNYHYENASLIFKDGKVVRVAPIIDMEFSQFFMYPDDSVTHEAKFSSYDEGMLPIFTYDESKSYEENEQIFIDKIENGSVHDNFNRSQTYILMRNIRYITKRFPRMVKSFINRLIFIRREVENFNISFDDEFLGTFSSNDWEPTRMIFKDGKSEDDIAVKSARERAERHKIKLDYDNFNNTLRREVIYSIDHFIEVLELFLDYHNGKLPNLRDYSANTLYSPVERQPENIANIFLQLMKDVKKKELK